MRRRVVERYEHSHWAEAPDRHIAVRSNYDWLADTPA